MAIPSCEHCGRIPSPLDRFGLCPEALTAKETCVLGIDYGTDSVRALPVNARNGEEAASAVRHSPRGKEGRYCDPSANRFRQHPLDPIERLEADVRETLAQAPAGAAANIRGIAVDTTGSTPGPAGPMEHEQAMDVGPQITRFPRSARRVVPGPEGMQRVVTRFLGSSSNPKGRLKRDDQSAGPRGTDDESGDDGRHV